MDMKRSEVYGASKKENLSVFQDDNEGNGKKKEILSGLLKNTHFFFISNT